MDPNDFTPRVYTPFAELDLLLSEVDQDAAPMRFAPDAGDDAEPETVDAFKAQILAGLVSP
jgi:hypothetical protein